MTDSHLPANALPQVSTWGAFRATLKRDLLVAFKRRNDLLNPIMFFLIVVSLFPLGVSPDPVELSRVSAGVIWVSALLASMLSLDNLYRADYEDGSLEQLLLSPQHQPLADQWFAGGYPLAAAGVYAVPAGRGVCNSGTDLADRDTGAESVWLHRCGPHCGVGQSRADSGGDCFAAVHTGAYNWCQGSQ